jgi:hypothetical protein
MSDYMKVVNDVKSNDDAGDAGNAGGDDNDEIPPYNPPYIFVKSGHKYNLITFTLYLPECNTRWHSREIWQRGELEYVLKYYPNLVIPLGEVQGKHSETNVKISEILEHSQYIRDNHKLRAQYCDYQIRESAYANSEDIRWAFTQLDTNEVYVKYRCRGRIVREFIDRKYYKYAKANPTQAFEDVDERIKDGSGGDNLLLTRFCELEIIKVRRNVHNIFRAKAKDRRRRRIRRRNIYSEFFYQVSLARFPC